MHNAVKVQTTIVSYYANARSGDINANIRIATSSTTLYSENQLVSINGGNYATYNGTVRTTTDGSTAWSDR